MAINVNSVNTTVGLQGATASGGIAGGPTMTRAPQAAGKLQIGVDSYVTLGTETVNSVLQWWPGIMPTGRLVYALLQWGNLGANALLSLGKVDQNNAANTDGNHYLNPTAAATSGSALANKNVGEQVGQDPLGDFSVGNTPPNFGAQPIFLTSTFTGATAAASQNLVLVFFFVSGA